MLLNIEIMGLSYECGGCLYLRIGFESLLIALVHGDPWS